MVERAYTKILAAAERANPAHVGLIMDGNGRWAKARGLSRTAGHEAGLEAFRKILNATATFGVPILTVFGFSSENWQRPEDEVEALMGLLVSYLQNHRHEFQEQDCRFVVTGRRHKLAPHVRKLVEIAEAETAHCNTRLLNLALSYGGREELTDAVRAIAAKVAAGILSPEAINQATLGDHLYLRELPDPDLIIRTSGEQRLSGFLPWQSAYSELVFHEALWPDFTPAHFLACLEQYRGRERRFGLTAEQVSA